MGSYSQSRNRPGRNSADSPFSDQACKGLEETGGEFLVVICDQKTEVDTSFCHKWLKIRRVLPNCRWRALYLGLRCCPHRLICLYLGRYLLH